jgi:UDP-N-acetylglucosamine acyltransferase
MPVAGDALIHPTAVVDPSSKLEEGVQVGPYAVIGPDCRIGAGTWIGSHAVLEHVTVGKNVKIHPHAFVGTPPQDLKFKGEPTRAEVGDNTVIRECVTLNRGTSASGKTVVGKNCLLMAYVHVAHDCVVGDNVVMANNATLAGHVEVADNVVMGGMCAVHQFTRIGTGAMVGGASMVAQDVAPFCMTHGNRAWIVGLNVVGLKRSGLPRETITAIKDAYKTFFLSNLTLQEAAAQAEKSPLPREARLFVDFLKASKRGFCRPKAGAAEDAAE